MDAKKRGNKEQPTRECQYGNGCYRKNPNHFSEYAHRHLSSIRSAGKDPVTKQYVVPDEYFMSQDIILEQLDILDKLYPNMSPSTPAKKPKLNKPEADAKTTPTTPMNPSSSSSSSRRDLNIASIFNNKKETTKSPRNETQVVDTVIDLLDSPAKDESKNKPETSRKETKAVYLLESPQKNVEVKRNQNGLTSLSRSPKVTATQLKNSLKATFEKISSSQTNTGTSTSTSTTNVPTTSTQKDQLAAYRMKHIQNRQATTSSTSAPSTTTSQPQQAHSSAEYRDSSKPSTSTQGAPPRNIKDYISVVNPRGQMANKLKAAAPYNFFLTTITDSKPTHSEPLSITFQEILDPSLGDIESTVQINFMVDIGWLLGHYYFAGCLDKPMLVLYGDETPELQTITTKKPQVTAIKVHMSSPFGTHHTKMMLLGYKDGSMRVIVSTANLVEDDWHNRTQGIWMSPRCAALPDDTDTATGDSETGFREDLVRYLVTYNLPKLQPWIARIRRTDFHEVNVFFVASVPGGHRSTPRGYDWGHARVGHLLNQHSGHIDEAAPIVAQSSSIGSLGPNVHTWIMNDIANSFRRDSRPLGIRRLPAFRLIYPSFANVKASHDDLLGGGCLPYRKVINEKQTWLKGHMQQWKSRRRHRTQAMPHIKTYCRWSQEGVYWFVLTSANLSKAAWGAFNKGSTLDLPLRIMSYEAGVLFLPKFVLKSKDAQAFPLDTAKNGVPPFPMPYDLPLQPYTPDDTPFVMDYLLDRM